MDWIKGFIQFLRAIINAPEMLHWINKYEAAKRDNDQLRKELNEARKFILEYEKWLNG